MKRLLHFSALSAFGSLTALACSDVPADTARATDSLEPGESSLWPDTARPAVITDPDAVPIELGVKFRSDVDGSLRGIRFYKGPSNTGPHVGNLWSQAGALLGTVRFENETASGWQTARFVNPVAIRANTTYVASYHTTVGRYSANNDYFAASEHTALPLRALREGIAGGNGVYRYGASGFPTSSFRSSNYWVDVVFAAASAPSSGGLRAEYFDNSDFTNPRLTRTDPTLNFNWGSASPSAELGADTFSVRWSGTLRPRLSETYTFSTMSDDGVRLWVNGQLVIDNWTLHGPTRNTGNIALTAGQAYPIRLEYFENAGGATLQWFWRSASQPEEIVPQSQLTPGASTGTDTTPPSVSIASPAAGATVSATVELRGSAADNQGLARVEVQIDGGAFQPASGTSTWSFNVATTQLTNGSHTLTVRATDTSGNTSVATRSLVVNNTSSGGGLNLPRVEWEGGPAYYRAHSYADQGGWDDPSFFPIGVWFEGTYSQADIDLDKDVGLNTYVQLTSSSNRALIRQNGMFTIWGGSGSGSETVGYMLDDEVDMWGGPGTAAWTGNYPGQGEICSPSNAACGYTIMQARVAELPADGRFRYSNYGKGVMLWQSDAQASRFVNDYTTVVSNDIYWYTDPNICGEMQNFLGLPSSTCRLAANYGVTMDKMRRLDGMDGKRQPVWAFIEVGHPFTESFAPSIQPNQIAGAVMASIIHEARGILYFNHSFGGPCISQHALRESCYSAQRAKVKETNQRIKELAPVLNTQSYAHTFNTNLDTMLKGQGGSYYVFAMLGRARAPGSYTFTLPAGLTASSVQVLYENRTLPVAGGSFSDSFAAEHTYHIYKITP